MTNRVVEDSRFAYSLQYFDFFLLLRRSFVPIKGAILLATLATKEQGNIVEVLVLNLML